MKTEIHYIEETASTNLLLKEKLKTEKLPEGYVLQTDFQSSGKGMGSNSWESAKGKNLLFSIFFRPTHLAPDEQFLISQIVSLGVLNALRSICLSESERILFSLKWPNDIYWKDHKLGGILIENTWQGKTIATSIAGIGLNVNQLQFVSDAPNPVSLAMIFGREFDLNMILEDILQQTDYFYTRLTPEDIRREYFASLYRNRDFHPFRIHERILSARIATVEPDGRLILEDEAGNRSGYYFKEVEFVL